MTDSQRDPEHEVERRAWARFVVASVDMAAVQMTLAVGPTRETVSLFEAADAELAAATDALERSGVDVAKYLEAQ